MGPTLAVGVLNLELSHRYLRYRAHPHAHARVYYGFPPGQESSPLGDVVRLHASSRRTSWNVHTHLRHVRLARHRPAQVMERLCQRGRMFSPLV